MKKAELNEIVIEVTNRCNLNCDFCMIKQKNETLTDLDSDEIKKIINQAKKENCHGIRFTGGEPLLYKNIKDVIDYSNNNNLYTIMNTNTTLINKNKDSIKNLDMLLISFHDFNNISQLKKNIKTIISINKNIKIIVASILSKNNIPHLESLYSSISTIKKTICEWILLTPIKNKTNSHPISTEDIEIASKKIRNLNNRYNYDIKISNSTPYCATKDNINDITKINNADGGISRLYIKSNGDITTDSYSSDILGNIKSTTINNIWNSKKIIEIKKLKNVSKFCEECYYLEKCKGNCINNNDLINYKNIKPLVSIIIPTYNNSEMLSIILESLMLQTVKKSSYEVIIVDDGSNDNTKEIYSKHKNAFFSSKYLFQEDLGFRAGQARNLGAKNSIGKILIFLDDDSVPHPEFIKNHINEQSNYDVVLGYNASYGNARDYSLNLIKKTIRLNKLSNLPVIPEFRSNLFNSNVLNNSNNNNKFWWAFAAGNLSIKKKLFDDYKFDNDFVGWAEEDVDLGFRLQKDKKNMYFSKKCMAFNIRETKDRQISMITREKFISTTKNQMLLTKKHNNNEDVVNYVVDRFSKTPNEIKLNSTIDFKNNLFMP